MFTKSKNNAINIITIIAGIGVFAGALALFIVLSGFSGLKEFSLSFSNEFDPDLKVLPTTGKTFSLSQEEKNRLKEISGIKNYSSIVEERVLLNFNKKNLPAFIKGIDDNYLNVNHVDSALIAGTWLHQQEKQVVIGASISRKLSLGVMDYSGMLKMMVPRPGKGQVIDPRKAFHSEKAMVIGVYNINEELNGKYVFTPLTLAQDLLELDENSISGIEIELKNTEQEIAVTQELRKIFDEENFSIKNRMQLNDKLYKMLNTENLAVYLIFTLVLIIALFNVGGAIVMAILDKQHNIKTLFNLGARAKEIKRIFFLQGSLLTFIGGVLGLFVGWLIIFLQLKFDLVMITPTLAYPVKLVAENFVVVFFTIMILGVSASYIGATRVGKILRD